MRKISKTNKFSLLKSMILLILCFACLFSVVSPINVFTQATEETYSSVITDLEKDPNFNIEDYPVIEDDYSLYVISIAESSAKELFVYVYQPSATLLATSINISTAINESYSPQNYSLSLLSSEGPLFKYLVEDFVVKEDLLRYYDIPSIFRFYNESIDEPNENNNEIIEISFSVGKLYTASTVDGSVSYTCVSTETIEITDKYVGFVEYLNGFFLYKNSCYAYYVAFSTDREIDRLLEADIYFTTRTVEGHENLTGVHFDEYGPSVSNNKTLYSDEQASNPNWWLIEKHTWQRIENVSEFITNESLEEDAYDKLADKQFVLRFFESEYKEAVNINGVKYFSYTEASQVTILRLKFETDGVTYNLGVVDNKQNPGTEPDNEINVFYEIADWLKWILIAIGAVLAVILVLILLSLIAPLSTIFKFIFNVIIAIFKAVWWVIKNIAKGLWWLITAPFELIKGDS